MGVFGSYVFLKTASVELSWREGRRTIPPEMTCALAEILSVLLRDNRQNAYTTPAAGGGRKSSRQHEGCLDIRRRRGTQVGRKLSEANQRPHSCAGARGDGSDECSMVQRGNFSGFFFARRSSLKRSSSAARLRET